MKKSYIKPQLMTVCVKTGNMIALSIVNTDATTNGYGDYEDARENTYIQPHSVWED